MVEEFCFKSSTGKDLYARKWYDENLKEYIGVVQLVHGMEENILRYDDFANFLASKGFIVVGYDHLGHGKSVEDDSKLGHFDCKDGWFRLTEDIHILQNKIKKENKNLPYVLLGHSMGSLLVRTYLTIYDDNLSAVILSGTSGKKNMLHLGVALTNFIKLFRGNKYKSQLIEGMVTGAFNNHFKPTRTELDWMTSDEKIIDEYLKVINPNRKFTLEGYLQLLKGSIYLNKKDKIKNTVNIPILFISGDNDPVGEMGKGVTRAYDMLIDTGLEDVTLKLFEGGRHEMLNEVNRGEVYEYILEWIDSKIL